MALALSIIGLLVFLLLKKTIFNLDTGRDLWCSVLEIAVDVNLIGFMLTVTSISQLSGSVELAPHALLSSIAIMVISISVWKYLCTLITENSLGATILQEKRKRFWALVIVNCVLAAAAIVVPWKILGANL